MFHKMPESRQVLVFLALLILLSSLALLVPGRPAGLYMLAPALTTLLMLLVVTRDGRRAQGWRALGFRQWRGHVPSLLVALLLPLVVVSAGYLLLPALGVSGLNPPEGGMTTVLKMILALVPAATVSALMEEVGWRGYLLPRLARFGSVTAGLTLGLVWAAWHLPVMLAGSYHAGEPLDASLLLFALTIVAFGFIANELRMRTLSLWPVALLHGAHNAAWHVLRDLPASKVWAVNLVAGEKGLVTLALYGLVAVLVVVVPGTWTASRRSPTERVRPAGVPG
ncbi:CPBP family intramembrane glutamic endopeptidase [Deinococcus pimensis]|uniref:CPBP family intramembrane glutamic endopeptidase n=1 Tax=Deinococcus pimensis TaxID=309888 RepID=UPI000489A576|nr:CPBP family intramembrane glutamic endopeptidase [Deinococcus pimensis]